MSELKTPRETPARTSDPTPVESPAQPEHEFEAEVPHQRTQPIAKGTEAKGEGSYEGTRQYNEGLASSGISVESAQQRARKIDTADPALKRAEKIGKSKRKDT